MRAIVTIFGFILAMLFLQGLVGCGSTDAVSGCTKRETKKANKHLEKAWLKCPDAALNWAINRFPPKHDTITKESYILGETKTLFDTTIIKDTINNTVTKVIYKDRLRTDTLIKYQNVNTTDGRELAKLREENSRLKNQPEKKQIHWEIILGAGIVIGIFAERLVKTITQWKRP